MVVMFGNSFIRFENFEYFGMWNDSELNVKNEYRSLALCVCTLFVVVCLYIFCTTMKCLFFHGQLFSSHL